MAIINGTSLPDYLRGTTGNDTIYGFAGNDLIDGGLGIDTMVGGQGDDIYYVDSASDAITELSGEGNDTVITTVDYVLGSGAIETLVLQGGALVGTGNLYNNGIQGTDGANVLSGMEGNDILSGGAGNDRLYGGAGDDIIAGGTGNDLIHGGGGNDTADYSSAASGVTASLAITTNQYTKGDGWDRFVSIENLNGSDFNDTLTGDAGQNVLDGGAGNDRLDGGDGIDTVSYCSAENGVSVNLGVTGAQETGHGADTLVGFESILGSYHDDTLIGSDGANVLRGNKGNDILDGRIGNDTLIGGIGTDTLTGGRGADKFVFQAGDTGALPSNADVITDFTRAQGDKIDLALFDANSTASGIQDFAFIGNGAFTGKAGELRFDATATDTFLFGDTNGDGNADFVIRLNGAIDLQAGDFIF